jgi:hypothetical protein
MPKALLRWLTAAGVIAAGVVTAATMAVGGAGPVSSDGDTPTLAGGQQPLPLVESDEQRLESDYAFTSKRLAGDTPISLDQAGELRGKAAEHAKKLRKEKIPSGPTTFTAPGARSARIRSSRRRGLGRLRRDERPDRCARHPPEQRPVHPRRRAGGHLAVQLGDRDLVPKTNDSETQAIGALAIAPSDDSVIYAGTGEGALSGDSYFGNGVLKSTDGGNTWTHISDDKYFQGVAMSRIAVDPTDKNHLFAAVLRGRGGARRTSPTDHTKFGVWESTDGGVTWKRVWTRRTRSARPICGSTRRTRTSSTPRSGGDAIYRSTDGGKKWKPIMNGLPDADYEAG